jgi:hypothetical protein
MEQLKRGTIREYKLILCFDQDVIANDPELRSGTVRVGEGPGTINRRNGEHFRDMLQTKGCFVYLAPVVLRNHLSFYGTEKAAMSVDTADPITGARAVAGAMIFCDPSNAEIIEQFRQIKRATERWMLAVHTIIFPEDTKQSSKTASR